MSSLLDSPWVILPLSLCALSLCAWLGAHVFDKYAPRDDRRADFDILLAATLTLLALMIGFTFSMAAGRYEQRKNYEEGEADAIGTEYARAGLLTAADAAKTRMLLKTYLNERILFYSARDEARLRQIDAQTADLQQQLWSTIESVASAERTPMLALVVSGMNDVLNSQSHTQAAWWNRIPGEAWVLLALIAVVGNVMFGYGVRSFKEHPGLFLILPLVVSMAFFLIADIDSPRGGIVRVTPENLQYLAGVLR